MLDPKLLRNDLDSVVAQLARKGVVFDVSAYQALETKRKSLQLETESLQNKRKDGSKSVGLLMKDGKKDEKTDSRIWNHFSLSYSLYTSTYTGTAPQSQFPCN